MSLSVESAVLLVTAVMALAALVLALRTSMRQRALNERYTRLFGTANEGTIKDVLSAYATRVQDVGKLGLANQGRLSALEKSTRYSLQTVGLVRFNPFVDTGGDQSFALAMADAQGNGIVLSSLHARGLTRIYAKPLVDWDSPYQLSDEERQAIGQALAASSNKQESDEMSQAFGDSGHTREVQRGVAEKR